MGVYFDTKVVNDTADDQAANITVSNNNIAIVEKHAPGVGETPAASGVSGFEPAADANTVVGCEKLTDIIVDDDFTAKDGEVVTVNGKNYIMGTNAFATINGALTVIQGATGDADVKYTIQLDGTFNEDVLLNWSETNDVTFTKAAGAEKAEITGRVQVGSTTGSNAGLIPVEIKSLF